MGDGRPAGLDRDGDLRAALAEVGTRLAFPPDPGAAFPVAVAAAIERARSEPARRAGAGGIGASVREWLRAQRPLRRALVLAAAAVLLLATAATAATFAVRGIRIVFGPPPAATAPPPGLGPSMGGQPPASASPTLGPLGSDLFLGEHTTIEAARARLRFDFVVPTLPGLGRPEVYVSQVVPGGAVNLVYPAPGGTPTPGTSDAVGVLITEFVGRVDRPFLQKFIDQGTTVQHVRLGSWDALWISGEPHQVAYVASDGSLVTESLRLSGNALLWERGDLTLRLETVLPLERARAIAASMR
jgi:hypothetical protein